MSTLLDHYDPPTPFVIQPGGEGFVEESHYVLALGLAFRHFGVLQVIGDDELAALAGCAAAHRGRDHVPALGIHKLVLLVLIAGELNRPARLIPGRGYDRTT